VTRKPDAGFLEPLHKTRLHEEIVERFKDRIIRGEIPPGERLPTEREIAESLGVNRSTVREAVKKLEALELVEIKHGRGVFVKDYLDSCSMDLLGRILFLDGVPNLEILRGLLDLRKLVLPEIARRAAMNRTELDVEALRRAVQDTGVPVAERDHRVHNLIARASGNPLFAILLNSFTRLLADHASVYFDRAENRQRSEAFHREILEAIEAGEAQRAAGIMYDVLVFAERAAYRAYAGAEEPREAPRPPEESP